MADVDEARVERSLRTLPQPPRGRWPPAAAGLPHWLRLWRQQNLLPPRPSPSARPEATQWLGRSAQYLEHVCGAAPSTRTASLRIAPRLLAAMFGSGRVPWRTVSAPALTDFVRQEVAAAQWRRPLAPARPGVPWGTDAGLGSRRAHPPCVDACPAPLPLDGRGSGVGSRHLDRRQSQGPAASRDLAAPGPPRHPGACRRGPLLRG